METWEWLLLGFAGLVAVRHLVRLMRQRRYEVLVDLHKQAEDARQQQVQESEGSTEESPTPAR